MAKTFVILSGAPASTYGAKRQHIRPQTETASSATEALELVQTHMRLRHPGLIIETTDGEELLFFQLKDLAQSETREQNALRTKRRGPNLTRS
jgi:hypothetical protein